MEGITIHAGDIAATCETAEQAAALVRALQSGPSEAPAKRRPRTEANEQESKPRRTKKSQTDEGGSRGDIKQKLFSALEKNPNADVRTLAEKVYGEDGAAQRARIYSMLSAQVKRGALKRLSTGGYKVV